MIIIIIETSSPQTAGFGKAVGIRDYYVDGGKEWIDN